MGFLIWLIEAVLIVTAICWVFGLLVCAFDGLIRIEVACENWIKERFTRKGRLEEQRKNGTAWIRNYYDLKPKEK
jgi:hypothetical protein